MVGRVVHITVQVLPNPFGPLGAALGYVFVEMIEVGFIEPVAFVGEGPVGNFDQGVDGEARDLGPVRLTTDLLLDTISSAVTITVVDASAMSTSM